MCGHHVGVCGIKGGRREADVWTVRVVTHSDGVAAIACN